MTVDRKCPLQQCNGYANFGDLVVMQVRVLKKSDVTRTNFSSVIFLTRGTDTLSETTVSVNSYRLRYHSLLYYLHPLGFGGVCPVGYYCPPGTVTPLGCPSGSYQDEHSKTYCKSCLSGYYCLSNSSSYINNECPVGKNYLSAFNTMPI